MSNNLHRWIHSACTATDSKPFGNNAESSYFPLSGQAGPLRSPFSCCDGALCASFIPESSRAKYPLVQLTSPQKGSVTSSRDGRTYFQAIRGFQQQGGMVNGLPGFDSHISSRVLHSSGSSRGDNDERNIIHIGIAPESLRGSRDRASRDSEDRAR